MITQSLLVCGLINGKYPQGEEMIKEALLTTHHYRDEVADHIVENDYKTVIDVGGAMNAWPNIVSQARHGRDIVTAHMDYNCHLLDDDTVKFGGNMSNWWEWQPVLEYVQTHGKFEFCICTQTLEDIRDPVTVLMMLPHIANKGYIDVPSKYLELRKGCEGDMMDPKRQEPRWGIHSPFFGFTGHRWIMNMIDNVLWMLPKLSFVEVIEGLERFGDQLVDGNGFLAIWWEGDSIPHCVVGDDFLGPNPPAVFNMYRECLSRGL